MQERCNSSVLAMELRLYCINPLIRKHFDWIAVNVKIISIIKKWKNIFSSKWWKICPRIQWATLKVHICTFLTWFAVPGPYYSWPAGVGGGGPPNWSESGVSDPLISSQPEKWGISTQYGLVSSYTLINKAITSTTVDLSWVNATVWIHRCR